VEEQTCVPAKRPALSRRSKTRLFFHRRLRCLVVIDLKVGKFTHADAGQMHVYLNYAREHWTHPGENPPVGLILCAQKDDALARYAQEWLPNKVLAAEYRMVLPDERTLAEELARTRRLLEATRTPGDEAGRKQRPRATPAEPPADPSP